MKTFLTQFGTLAIVVALNSLAGCASPSPVLDSRFGNSINALKAYQTMYPGASANSANPGMDGVAAREGIERYNKSYSAPSPQPNVFTIGIGGGAQ